MKTKQKWMPFSGSGQENAFLRSRAVAQKTLSVERPWVKSCYKPLHFVIVNDKFLLQNLNRVEAVGFLLFRQHDFSEISFSEHGQEVEVIQPHLAFPGHLSGGQLLLLRLESL